MAYDEAATEMLRNDAMQRIEPIMQQHLAGSTLVRAGELASKQNLLMLKNHEQMRRDEQEEFDQFMEVVGWLLNLMNNSWGQGEVPPI